MKKARVSLPFLHLIKHKEQRKEGIMWEKRTRSSPYFLLFLCVNYNEVSLRTEAWINTKKKKISKRPKLKEEKQSMRSLSLFILLIGVFWEYWKVCCVMFSFVQLNTREQRETAWFNWTKQNNTQPKRPKLNKRKQGNERDACFLVNLVLFGVRVFLCSCLIHAYTHSVPSL